MTAPILFLDVDGVLNSSRYPAASRRGGIMKMAPEHVAELVRVVEVTGCEIVVSSSWRHGGIDKDSDFHRSLVKAGGWLVYERVIGATRDLRARGKFNRGDEIALWLDSETESSPRFAIVDDDSDMGALLPYLVQTTFAEGLTAEIADQLIARLS